MFTAIKRRLSSESGKAFAAAITCDAEAISARLRQRLSLAEAAGFGLGLAMAFVFIWLHTQGRVVLYDFENYLAAAGGDYSNYYYAYWLLPVFSLLTRLPFHAAYLLWAAASMLAVWFAARVFGGNAALALFSYQLLYSLYYGQVTALLAGGLGLLWWGVANRRWWVAGLGLALAASKFQSGALFAGVLFLSAVIGWRERVKMLALPGAALVISLLLYPGWPLRILAVMQSNPANADGSLSLWRWVGAWALLVFLPPLVLPLPRQARLWMWLAAVPLGLPYFQQADLIELFVLPAGWLPVLAGNLAYLYLPFGHIALQMMFILPLGLYVWEGLQGVRALPAGVRKDRAADLEKPA